MTKMRFNSPSGTSEVRRGLEMACEIAYIEPRYGMLVEAHGFGIENLTSPALDTVEGDDKRLQLWLGRCSDISGR